VQIEGEKVPPTVSWKLTDPVGTVPAPDPLSWTVAVHVVDIVGAMSRGSHWTETETGCDWVEVVTEVVVVVEMVDVLEVVDVVEVVETVEVEDVDVVVRVEVVDVREVVEVTVWEVVATDWEVEVWMGWLVVVSVVEAVRVVSVVEDGSEAVVVVAGEVEPKDVVDVERVRVWVRVVVLEWLSVVE
jgi:hypothetical protein